MKKVIVIQGVTASGKTDLAVALAKKFNLKIINADSTQVYKGFDIGTAKITESEMQGVEHFLLSFKDYLPNSKYSTYEFQQAVRTLIEKSSKPLIIVGGSGYYLKSALYSLDFKATKDLKNTEFSISEKIAYLKAKGILIDFQNTRKVENYFQTNSLDFANFKQTIPIYDMLVIETELAREHQTEVFQARIETQFQNGFLKEVRKLKSNGLKECDILGYHEILMYLDGLTTLSETKQNILKHTLDLAKKQKTWFKNQTQPHLVLNCFDKHKLAKAEKAVYEFLTKWPKLYSVQL